MKKNRNGLEELKAAINRSLFYCHMGLKVLELKNGSSLLILDYKNTLMNMHGIAHGGVLASLVDACSGLALYSLLEADEEIVTVDLHVNYIAPFTEGRITGKGKALHRGKNTGVSEGEVFDESGKLLAKGMATFFIHTR